MLASESVEMVQYNALVSHLVSMERRVPVQHFFDGFRTSHEVRSSLGHDSITADWSHSHLIVIVYFFSSLVLGRGLGFKAGLTGEQGEAD